MLGFGLWFVSVAYATFERRHHIIENDEHDPVGLLLWCGSKIVSWLPS
jgi:hypothetical protein